MLAFKTVTAPQALSEQLEVFEIKSEDDAIALGDYLQEIDRTIHNGDKSLRGLSNVLGALLERYNKTLPSPEYTSADMLRFMMDQHGHKQQDLESVMARSTVSAVLNGHRELTVAQMQSLGKFYQMDPTLFLTRERN